MIEKNECPQFFDYSIKIKEKFSVYYFCSKLLNDVVVFLTVLQVHTCFLRIGSVEKEIYLL